MTGGRILTPQEVVERLNRSLEQELENLEGFLPVTSTCEGAPVPQQFREAKRNGASLPAKAKRYPAACDSVGVGVAGPRMRASASLLDKLEESRLHALEALSSVLFEHDRGDIRPSTEVGVKGAVGEKLSHHPRGCLAAGQERRPATATTRRRSLQERLRQRAAILVKQERESLLHQLHAELDLERNHFEATKPALSEEAYRAARREQASALEKQEHELRMVLARRELKDLTDVARERLAIAHAQEKEKTLARLRRSLGRGTGHSVSGLREELWEEAHEKRTRALHEGEAAFEHSCRLLRQESDLRTKAKIEVMAEEATIAEQSALGVLREVEAKATAKELSTVTTELERERREAEVVLKQQLHRESARSVSLAVDGCTSKQKRAQQEVTASAADALRRALEVEGENEVARTRSVLGREARMLDDRRFWLVSMVEDGLSACSLRKLAETSRSSLPPSSPSSSSSSSSPSSAGRLRSPFLSAPSGPSPTRILTPERNRTNGGRKAEVVGRRSEPADGPAGGRHNDGDDVDVRSSPGRTKKTSVAIETDIDADGHAAARSPKGGRCRYAGCAAAAAAAVKAVRHVEAAAAAAEREYAKRARDIVRLRAAVALKDRNDEPTRNGVVGVADPRGPPAVEREKDADWTGRRPTGGGSTATAGGADGGRVGGRGGLVGCGGCAVLFEANERLLEKARARGFINE